MGRRGPKSDDQKRMAGFHKKTIAFPCPKTLSREGRVLWRSIVAAYPADYFRAGDLPLLEAYCMEWERHARAQRMLIEKGEVIGTKCNPWHKILVASSCAMCQIATKLRLCANSRATYKTAASTGALEPASKSRAGLMFGDDDRMPESNP